MYWCFNFLATCLLKWEVKIKMTSNEFWSFGAHLAPILHSPPCRWATVSVQKPVYFSGALWRHRGLTLQIQLHGQGLAGHWYIFGVEKIKRSDGRYLAEISLFHSAGCSLILAAQWLGCIFSWMIVKYYYFLLVALIGESDQNDCSGEGALAKISELLWMCQKN